MNVNTSVTQKEYPSPPPRVRRIPSGTRYGHLVVQGFSHTQGGYAYWHCKCDCGKACVIPAASMKSGNTKGCGCGMDLITHGYYRGGTVDRLYHIWKGMIARCTRETASGYRYYGGRGIAVCNEWQDSHEVFRDWAITNGYGDDLEIDRIDNDGNYCQENCQWANRSQQSKNRRDMPSQQLTAFGKTQGVAAWAREFYIPREKLHEKLRWNSRRTVPKSHRELLVELLIKIEKEERGAAV